MRTWQTTAASALAIVAAGGTMAIARGAHPTVKATTNATVGKTIVVDRGGRTLYRLTGESRSHLLCKSSACLGIWRPLTVRSKHAKLVRGKGVHGRLSTVKRTGHRRQVTLRGLPLYRYAGDSAPGDAAGEGITSFGGTWHVLPASDAPVAAEPEPAPEPAPDPYPYPPYY